MQLNELLKVTLDKNTELFKKHLADFSDEDLLVRPTPRANHAAWQLAHLIALEAIVANLLDPAAGFALPPGFPSTHGPGAVKGDDDTARFPTKAQMLGLFEKARAVQSAALAKTTAADLDRPGPEAFRGFADTVGELVLMTPAHAAMHLGQIQVIRRKLGKPLVF